MNRTLRFSAQDCKDKGASQSLDRHIVETEVIMKRKQSRQYVLSLIYLFLVKYFKQNYHPVFSIQCTYATDGTLVSNLYDKEVVSDNFLKLAHIGTEG